MQTLRCGMFRDTGSWSPLPPETGILLGYRASLHAEARSVACVQCGQCAAVCTVGAISERSHIESVLEALEDPKKHVVVQTAPAIRAALGECFGYPPWNSRTERWLQLYGNSASMQFSTRTLLADLTIMEEGTELLSRSPG